MNPLRVPSGQYRERLGVGLSASTHTPWLTCGDASVLSVSASIQGISSPSPPGWVWMRRRASPAWRRSTRERRGSRRSARRRVRPARPARGRGGRLHPRKHRRRHRHRDLPRHSPLRRRHRHRPTGAQPRRVAVRIHRHLCTISRLPHQLHCGQHLRRVICVRRRRGQLHRLTHLQGQRRRAARPGQHDARHRPARVR
jgi:hypothetical protein